MKNTKRRLNGAYILNALIVFLSVGAAVFSVCIETQPASASGAQILAGMASLNGETGTRPLNTSIATPTPTPAPTPIVQARRLTTDNADDLHPSWSPDGRMIAFSSRRLGGSDGFDIFSINPDGTAERELIKFTITDTFGGRFNEPQWIGTSGDLLILEQKNFWEVMRANVSSAFNANTLPITRSVLDGNSANLELRLNIPGGQGLRSPVLSPDGTQCAWVDYALPNRKQQVRLIRNFGTGVQGYSDSAGVLLWEIEADGACADYKAIAFSPDGTKLLVAARVTGYSTSLGRDLYVINLANGTRQRLTTTGDQGVDNHSVAWASNGQIAFVARPNKDAAGDLYRMNADGTGLVRLTETTFDETMPSWSPNGSQLAFAADPAGQYDLYAKDVSTQPPCRYQIAADSLLNLPIAGGSYIMRITTAAGCPWTAVSDATWVKITPASGVGSGTVTAQVSINEAATTRQATLSIAGQTIPLSQQGRPAGERALRLVNGSGNAGGQVTMPLESVSTDGSEAGWQFSVSFDPAVLSNPQLVLGSNATGANLVLNQTQVAQGRLGALINLPVGQSWSAGTRQLAVLTFSAAANTSTVTTAVRFGDQPISREVVNAQSNRLTVTYNDATITVLTSPGFESDVAPRNIGDGRVTVADVVQTARMVAALDVATSGGEFQRADAAPASSKGDGRISVADAVQAARYAAALDPLVSVGGPTTPAANTPAQLLADETVQTSEQITRVFRFENAKLVRGLPNLVAVELVSQGDENGFSFSVKFDPAHVSFSGATLDTALSGGSIVTNTNEMALGRVGFVITLGAGQRLVAGARALVGLNFNINSTAQATATALIFDDVPVSREVVSERAEIIPAAWQEGNVTLSRALAAVSAASYRADELSADSISAVFGQQFSTSTAVGGDTDPSQPGVQLPTTLAGTRVLLRDSNGIERAAPLFFVSPTQINWLVPAGTAQGTALLIVINSAGESAAGTVSVKLVAPAIFGVNANGQGVAAAVALRVKAGSEPSYETIARFDQVKSQWLATPIDLGAAAEQVYLILYGTGLRFHSGLAKVTATIGGTNAQVLYARAQGSLVGLDQVNVLIPRSLIGRGDVDVALTVDGKATNPVKVNIK